MALLVCVTGWAQRLLVRRESRSQPAILVVEEAWECLHHLEVARWLRARQKLSRQHRLQVVLVLHRLSDLAATGGEGSEDLAVIRGLLADTETHVVFGMPAAEVAATRELLGLNESEAALLPELPPGHALWRIAGRSTVGELQLSPLERWICEPTDGSTDLRRRGGDEGVGARWRRPRPGPCASPRTAPRVLRRWDVSWFPPSWRESRRGSTRTRSPIRRGSARPGRWRCGRASTVGVTWSGDVWQ